MNNQTPPPPAAHDVNPSQSAPTEIQPQKTPSSDSEQAKRHIPWLKILVFGIVGVITIAAFALIAYLFIDDQSVSQTKEITSYEECVEAGYPIMESYPEKCAVPDGPSFTRELTEEEQAKLDPTAYWETYVNEEFGFSIKYPADWTINDQSYIVGENSNLSFAIKGPMRNDIPESNGEDAYYIRALKWDPESETLLANEAYGITGEQILFEKRPGEQAPESVLVDNAFILNSSEHETANQILSTFKFTDTENTADTSDWKTYTNTDLKFTFYYPDELNYLYEQFGSEISDDLEGNLLLQNFDRSDTERKESPSDFQTVVTAYKNSQNTSLKDYVKNPNKVWNLEEKQNFESILIDNKPAYKGLTSMKGEKVTTIWIEHNGYIFTINLSTPKSTQSSLFNQILSTFEFTE